MDTKAIIKTERLVLRQWQKEDLDPLASSVLQRFINFANCGVKLF